MGSSDQSGYPFLILYFMNKNFIDLTGQKFGRLTVIKCVGNNKDKGHFYYWLCRCNCGNFKETRGTSLQNGATQSCGCLSREMLEKGRQNRKTHGMSESPEFRIWLHLKDRCLNKNDKQYKNYGGRGIKVCKEWLNSFEVFYADMGKRPSKKHSIDRRNNDGNYCPENCWWVLPKVQSRNTRRNRMLTYKGETLCMIEWAERLNINYKNLWNRLNKGWNIEKAFTK